MAEDRAVSLAKQNEAQLTVFTVVKSVGQMRAWVRSAARESPVF